ncbi:DUF1361 domain-containing protein [Flavobacterium litorale]|uniref:DUF1361 domain-containing protein n=1 Tax=Flavobacterium litorale TaxID=2856519 RepID=A0ABX8V3Z8_9FLAO|nr:DUF1361 domain-containing protein [Flavobacterium litorale]QYJ67575.1 DUF1361 domain-containing protein [Flavobacterium litorale]
MKTLQVTFVNTFKQHYALLYLALFSVALLLVRIQVTQLMFYSFLVWNLFLAYLPLALSAIMMNSIKLIEQKIYFYPLLLVWLLLLPNAPYIITDFVHLKKGIGAIPIWYDVLLLASFAIGGVLAGLVSMKQVFNILSIKTNPLIAWFSIAAACFLSGFGVYLGRFLRYNSWDVLSKPITLLTDLLHNVANSTAFGMTLGFGCFLLLLFHLYYTSEK